jgi:F420H(2)-dependent quinone reductase
MNPRWSVAFDRKVGRWFYPMHRRLYEATDGRIGHRSPMGPMLLLTTTGRRSGQARTTPLLYMPDGDTPVVVGSNGGRPQAPAWLLNLEADPMAHVQVARRRWAVRAEVLRGESAAPLWPSLNAHYNGWSYYQQLTDRELPVVRLVSVD